MVEGQPPDGKQLTGYRPRFIRQGESWTVNGSPPESHETKTRFLPNLRLALRRRRLCFLPDFL